MSGQKQPINYGEVIADLELHKAQVQACIDVLRTLSPSPGLSPPPEHLQNPSGLGYFNPEEWRKLRNPHKPRTAGPPVSKGDISHE